MPKYVVAVGSVAILIQKLIIDKKVGVQRAGLRQSHFRKPEVDD